ncbi:MAG: YcgL domain-containing protein [Thiotrichales bacterium]|nr:YcgL domain-containing protein [Thiotrichales bacterium]
MTMMNVSVFKSPKKNELYLYVPQEDGLEKLPKEILVIFGEPAHVLDVELNPEKKLARVKTSEVLAALSSRGYFMQMPPHEMEKFSDITPPPERLDNIF